MEHPQNAPTPKPSIWRRLSRSIIYSLALIGGLNLLAATATLALLMKRGSKPMPERVVLELDLETPLTERSSPQPVDKLLQGEASSLMSVVTTLRRAAEDERVVGLVAHVGQAGLGTAMLQELRDAVEYFRKQKKFAVAWSESFGEGGNAIMPYYLSSAFDTIYLLPSGDLDLGGLASEQMFAKPLLDRLDIRAIIERREQYKTAMNPFLEEGFTDAHREMTLSILHSLYGQLLHGISEARKLSRADLSQLATKRLLSAQEALEARLVDKLAYRDEVYAAVKKKAGENAKLLYLRAYGGRLEGRPDSDKKIAMIYAVGPIARKSDNGFSPMGGSPAASSDLISAAFRAAAKDKNVGCIVLRVNSPGGSYIASDVIWRAVTRARKAGKPVICSMGNVAASGGYLAAAPANAIVAQPGTLTGSIGVIGGKLLLTDAFWERIGLRFELLQTTENADIWSSRSDFSPQQRKRFVRMIDRIYDDFVDKVAEGRDLNPDEARELARGRVYTGAQAKTHRLVDKLGGLPTAIRMCKKAAGLDPDKTLGLVTYPREKDLVESLLSLVTNDRADSSEDTGRSPLTRTSTGGRLLSSGLLPSNTRAQLKALEALLQQARLSQGEAGILAAPELVPFM